jgi:hypothetical protein
LVPWEVVILEKMKRSEFDNRYHYRLVDASKIRRCCGNCHYYVGGERTLAVGCNFMLQCMMTHGEITVNRRRGLCDLYQSKKYMNSRQEEARLLLKGWLAEERAKGEGDRC